MKYNVFMFCNAMQNRIVNNLFLSLDLELSVHVLYFFKSNLYLLLYTTQSLRVSYNDNC